LIFIFHLIKNLYIRYETVDINVAIATDAGVLMTPIVYNADQKVDFDYCLNEIIIIIFFI
jgi:pyruvate/2-oxoglutarate dehydrogenase complex dihydrolipoamide acyltransferase (E2) component